MSLRLTLIFSFAIMLSSCTVLDTPSASLSSNEEPLEGLPAVAAEPKQLSSSVAELAKTVAAADDHAQPTLYPGNDRHVKLPAVTTPISFIGEDVSLNFEQAPLSEVMHAIMSDILSLDYIVDHPVTGTVTLRTRTPVPRDQLLGILESLLKANKALMIRGQDGRFLISGSMQSMSQGSSLSSAHQLSVGFSTIIVPLQYISASNMEEILKPVAEESAFVRVDNGRNLLMLAGTRAQLTGWLEMIVTFDVDQLAGMSVGLFPLENSSVDEMNEVLNALLGEGGAAADLSHLIRIVPIKRLNSVLVVTPRAHYLEKVSLWIDRLDGSPDAAFERRLYVYPVQNTNASRLAELLNSIYSGGGQSNGSRRSGGSAGQPDVAPGMTPETIGGGTSGGSSAGSSISSIGSSGSSEVLTASEFSLDDVRVVADEENNALMIYSTGKNYKKIKVALDQLDIVPTQVLIEASIIEVTLTDELKYGLEWTFKNGLGDSYKGVGLLAGASGIPAISPGFSYTISNAAGNISGVLNALGKRSLLNIISTPSVMVLDNHTAYIHVGDQIPIVSGTTVGNGGNTVENISYRDTGVKLSVKPTVNAGGLVTMDIEQSVTDIGAVDTESAQPSFIERTISSRVAVRSGESVVLGGLIKENAKTGDSGIPFLYTLPIIGPLFGVTEKIERRTELLVIITPRAIYNESELRDVSREMRSHIRHMELIELPPAN